MDTPNSELAARIGDSPHTLVCYVEKQNESSGGGEAGWSAFLCVSSFWDIQYSMCNPLRQMPISSSLTAFTYCGFGLQPLLAIRQTLCCVGGLLAIHFVLLFFLFVGNAGVCQMKQQPLVLYCTSVASQCSAVTTLYALLFFFLAATPCLSLNPETPSHFVTCTNL